MICRITDSWDWLSGRKNLPEILLGYHQHCGSYYKHSHCNLFWRLDKICYFYKSHYTIITGACGLYWNQMLCERLDGRTGILLRKDGRPSKTRLSVLWMKRNYIKILFLTFQQNLQCSILNYPFARRHSMFFWQTHHFWREELAQWLNQTIFFLLFTYNNDWSSRL